MKTKFLLILILTFISMLFVTTNKISASSVEASDIVAKYYNDGVYTKKTEMYLTEETILQFKEHFHVNATPDRTTYYDGDYLLMGDFDGGFEEVNSGYMSENGMMYHFTYSGDVSNPITNKTYSMNTTIADYYIALDDMLEEGYFDNFSKVSETKYTYIVGNVNFGVEEKLHEFLWFSAPGLEDSIFAGKDSYNYFTQTGITLVLEEKSHPYHGEYLSIRILLTVSDIGKVKTEKELSGWETNAKGYVIPEGEELVLSEARVYKGNISFNEDDYLDLEFNVNWVDEDGTLLECDVVKYGEVPTYNGEIPSKESNLEFTYTFAGWDKEVLGATKDVTYTAIYTKTLNKYKITFKNPDGTIIETQEVNYNEYPIVPSNPTMNSFDGVTYKFVGWSEEFEPVTSAKTYYANYIKNEISYIDFGAKADGKTNDFESLYKAHAYANANNSNKVVATAGKTYYIGSSIPTAKLLEWANGILNGSHTTNHDSSCIYGANKEHINSYGAMTDCHGNVVTNELISWINNNLKTIKSTTAITINVLTNVDWNTAKFIIDDTNITSKVVNGTTVSNNPDKQYNTDIFTFVAGSYNYSEDVTGKLSADKNATMTDEEFSSIISSKKQLTNLYNQIKTSGINQSTTKLDLSLGYSAMIIIYNEDLLQSATRTIAGNSVTVGAQRIYIRSGGNANDGGIKRETILVDENGNIDPSTPIMYDYTRISKIVVCKLSIPQLVVSGGEFTTLVSKEDAKFGVNSDGTINNAGTTYTTNYIKRGININRSNVVLDGVKHYVANEYSLADNVNGLQCAHYNGFFGVNQCANVMIKNSVLTARRYGVSGTYDFNANLVCGITLKDCTQSNFWIIENSDGTVVNSTENATNAKVGYSYSTKTNNRILWGVGGTNFCKNMVYDGCTLSRFDAHQGLYNGRVINSTVNGISVIGMGEMIVENSRILSVSGVNNNSVVNLRSDYGSTWKGNVYIKNVTATASSDSTNYNLIYYQYTNHYFGYECYLPNLTVENFTLTNPTGKTIYLYNNSGTQSTKYASSMHKATLSDGSVNNNIINMPESISVDNTSKYDYVLNYTASGESFSGVSTTKCTIKWFDDDGKLLETDSLGYGQAISFNSSSKLKQDNTEYDYTFLGWSLTKGGEVLSSLPTNVTKDMTFYAVYKINKQKYSINFIDGNGNVIKTEETFYGETPIYTGNTPTKAADTYGYIFEGWSLTSGGSIEYELPVVTKDASYYAVFSKVALKGVTVNYLNLDGSTLSASQTFNYAEGEMYNITAKSISGYVANTDSVMGCASEGVVVNIYYSKLSNWDGSSVSTSLSGSGTKTAPYLINSAADLAYVKNNAASFSGKYLKMMVSVDVSKSPNFMIVGFKGYFDGNNCSVRGLIISSSSADGVGFFSIVTGGNTVSNLSVYGSVTGLSGSSKVGGLVGYLGGKVTNCHNYTTVKGVTKHVGGVVGHATKNSAGIINCNNYGSVTSTAEQAGGIIGYLVKNIDGCNNYGSVTSSSTKLGGIVGNAENTATINDCHNYGNVTSTSNEVGGVVGASGGVVKNCSNNAVVSANSKVAGIAGTADKATEISNCVNNATVIGKSTYTAGIVGTLYLTSNVRNCINNGDIISKGGYIGGIIGAAGGNSVSKISDCYNFANVKGSSEVGGIAGYSFATAGTIVCNCYNSGNVSGTVHGDIVGNISKFTVYDSHTWTLGEVNGTSRVDTCTCGATREVDVWDGSSASTSLTGAGTKANPYLIQSAADLAYFANSVTSGTNYSGKYFELTKSIDLNSKHLMIGNGTKSFAGVFDGDNNYVLNMNIINTANGGTGLFGSLTSDGTIKNIKTTGKVSGGQYTGSVVGYLNVGHLYNCINYADVTNTTGNGVGGVAGGMNDTSSIKNCINYGNLKTTVAQKHVGGITGVIWSQPSVIKGCINYGNIESSASPTGGIIGTLTKGTVTNCKNYGSVTSSAAKVGGIAGDSTGIVSNCQNNGAVNGAAERVGGIAGASSGKVIDCENNGTVTNTSNRTGGITGETASTIDGCVNNGSINGASYTGGITGTSTTVTISNCINYGSVVGSSNYAGGISGCVTTANTTIIKTCSNYGKITAAKYAGCIGGGNIKDSSSLYVIDCFNDSETITVVGNELGTVNIENMINYPLVKEEEDEEVINILMLSNSYGDDTKQWVHEIANEYGVKINVANLYIGGCVLSTHLTHLREDNAAYNYRYYEDGTWKNQADVKISDALGYKNWDYVMLQQGSSQSGLADRYSPLNEIMDRILAIKSDVKFFWNMTWAYEQDIEHGSWGNYNHDQMTMYNGILNAVQTQILTNDRIEFVVPNGTAIQNSRTSYIGDNLCRDVHCHLTYDFGRYIAGLTFFSKLTGIDISNIKYSPGLTDYDKAIAIESAQNALAKPFEITNSKYTTEQTIDLSKYTKIDWQPTEKAYWYSSNSMDLVTNVNNAPNFVASKKFTKAELPVGTIIVIQSGYQYRPDGWTSDALLDSNLRPGNIKTEYVVVTEDWWGDFIYRGFNISSTSGESLEGKYAEAIAAFNIYIPNNQ